LQMVGRRRVAFLKPFPGEVSRLYPWRNPINRDEALKRSDEALMELAEALKQGSSEALVKYLDTLSRFHRYSFSNCLLIAIQRPDATHFAGFQRWKRLGRYVKKGEKGIFILAPVIRRLKESEDDADASINDCSRSPQRISGFRAVHVFDISQTEGKDLPQFSQITGDPGEKLQRLASVIQGRGIELTYQENLGGADGRSEGGKITVLTCMPAAEEFGVLAHELAHELLHRSERRKETTRTIRELEAEAISFVVSKAAGLDGISRSADYIQLYSGDNELLRQSLDQIQNFASMIIEELLSPPEIVDSAAA
jgi:antirestriction protein ArdC